jgi:hypothetical protein
MVGIALMMRSVDRLSSTRQAASFVSNREQMMLPADEESPWRRRQESHAE